MSCYLLRTNVHEWSDEELWKAYTQLSEAEAAFRIHKTDLQLRPTEHQAILLERLGFRLPRRLFQHEM